MSTAIRLLPAAAFIISVVGAGTATAGPFAVEVVEYVPGTTPTPGYTDPAAALGSPERFTGEGAFPGVVSPFNPAFLTDEIVSVGEGGSLTLKLAQFATPQVGAAEIGVFTNVGLIDTQFPAGVASDPPASFGVDAAEVDVSEDAITWVALGSVTFDVPANGYLDADGPFATLPGTVPSDFNQPFAGALTDFGGLPYSDPGGADMLDLLSGSGGGTWLDISATGLSKVGYVRFRVPDDGDALNSSNFELDAVAVSSSAAGAPVPEPAAGVLLGCGAAALVGLGRPGCPRRRLNRGSRGGIDARMQT